MLYAMATLPCYHLGWMTGLDQLSLTSVGTGRVRVASGALTADQMSLLFHARSVPVALMDSISLQQDMMCRILGDCRVGGAIDSEVGDLKETEPGASLTKKFVYCRYDHPYSVEEIAEAAAITHRGMEMDDAKLIPLLQGIGARYAAEHVRAEHLV